MSMWTAFQTLLKGVTAIPAPPAAQVAPKPPEPGLKDPKAFYDAVRNGLLGPTLSQAEVEGCEALLAACKGMPLSWAAYAFATAYHETAHTMQPVKEYGGAAYFKRMYDPMGSRPDVAERLGNTDPGDGVKFCGRGYVQLTGRRNYAKASATLGVDLVGEPDLAMRPDIAAAILRQGMKGGWFTGKCFDDFLTSPANEAQFTQARRIINVLDRASLIAGYAMHFQSALKAGGWS